MQTVLCHRWKPGQDVPRAPGEDWSLEHIKRSCKNWGSNEKHDFLGADFPYGFSFGNFVFRPSHCCCFRDTVGGERTKVKYEGPVFPASVID